MYETSPGALIKSLHLSISLLLMMSLAAVPQAALSAGDDLGFANRSVCVAPEIQIPELLKAAPPGPAEEQELGLEGDSMDLDGSNKITMTGNAQVIQGARGVYADHIVYDRDNFFADLNGNVRFYTERGDEIKTDSMRLDVDSFIGETGKAQMRLADQQVPSKQSINYVEDYSLLAPFRNPRDYDQKPETKNGNPRVGGRVWADKIDIEGESFLTVNNGKYTLCPEGEDVAIYGDEIELDQTAGAGYAKNVKVKFKGVPILWTPALSFPLNDQRKSGILAPTIGSDERSGSILAVPYYFNLAENYDATLRPAWYAERGGQLYGEFRYLNEQGSGAIRSEYLADDKLFDDQDRYGYSVDIRQRYSTGWGLNIDLSDVSDTSYLNDFRNDINLTSSAYLQQRGELDYYNSYVYFRGMASEYTAVAPGLVSSKPYDRLPQLTFGVRPQDLGPFELALDAEWVTFDSEDNSNVTGSRFNFIPSIEMPYEPIYGYVKPRLSYHFINYQLDNLAGLTDDSPSVGVPIFSVDSGLYFERKTAWSGVDMTQTLEPRLMYVYVPEEKQAGPIFDSGEGSINSYNALFRENRFLGGDRVGDDNHIALGLTTRMLSDRTGQERLRASIGQLYYLSDREVGLLASDPTATESKSDIFAELNVALTNQIDIRSFMRWDEDREGFSSTTLGLDYSAGYRRDLSIDYFKDIRPTEDVSTSTEDVRLQLDWPLGPRWQFSTGQRYSITDDQFRESSYSLIYDSCCWAVGIRGSNILQSDGEFNSIFVVSFELDGLGKIDTGLL